MRGRITNIKRKNGYGFLVDEAGETRWFHANGLRTPGTFAQLPEGATVEFEPYSEPGKGPNGADGLRARDLRIA